MVDFKAIKFVARLRILNIMTPGKPIQTKDAWAECRDIMSYSSVVKLFYKLMEEQGARVERVERGKYMVLGAEAPPLKKVSAADYSFLESKAVVDPLPSIYLTLCKVKDPQQWILAALEACEEAGVTIKSLIKYINENRSSISKTA